MRHRGTVPGLAALLAVPLFAVVIRLQPGGPHLARAIHDLGQLLAAALACAACLARARRSRTQPAGPQSAPRFVKGHDVDRL